MLMPEPATMTDRHGPPRVAVLLEHYGRTMSPCASIRLHGYLDYLGSLGDIHFRSVLIEELQAYRPDIVIWHRTSVPTVREVDALTAIADFIGARLVYDLDDNLLDMDDHGEGHAYRDLRSAVARSLQVAHAVWCSTGALAARVSRVAGGALSVLPNTLDPRIWTRVPPSTAGGEGGPAFRLLYMGTRTHDQDFAFLCRVMASLEEKLPGRFRLTLVGVCQSAPIDAPWLELHGPPAEVGSSYPAFVHWLQQQHGFDLGVAPLVSGPFNDCKSPIKVMDYAAMGLPALASRMPAYTEYLRSGIDCFHADNEVSAWVDALIVISRDRSRLMQVANAARASVAPEVFANAAQLRLGAIRRVVSQ